MNFKEKYSDAKSRFLEAYRAEWNYLELSRDSDKLLLTTQGAYELKMAVSRGLIMKRIDGSLEKMARGFARTAQRIKNPIKMPNLNYSE